MIKSLTCIECPKGCRISVDFDGNKINSITGFQCKKGEAYAKEEVIDPKRILTSSVLTEGLELKMVPVRTNKAISKSRLMEAMEEVKKIRLTHQVKAGDAVIKDFVVPGIDLLATRGTA
jgi:CxxC motif-containing protein